MEIIIGIAMMYVWVHAIMILVNKKPVAKRTKYETGIIITGIVALLLIIVGSI